MQTTPTQKTYKLRDISVVTGRSAAAHERDLFHGRMPGGFRIGRSRYWLAEEIDAWVEHGCPPAKEWAPIWKRIKEQAGK